MNQFKAALFLMLSLSATGAHANRAVMEVLAASNNTIYIATTNARVGISTTSPVTTLDVAGNAQFGTGATKSTFSVSGALTLASGATLSASIVSATSMTTTGNASGCLQAGNTFYVDCYAGQVGIGTKSLPAGSPLTIATLGAPSNKILIGDVTGSANYVGISLDGDASVTNENLYMDSTAGGTLYLDRNANRDLSMRGNSTPHLLIKASGNVKIGNDGTSNASSLLEVVNGSVTVRGTGSAFEVRGGSVNASAFFGPSAFFGTLPTISTFTTTGKLFMNASGIQWADGSVSTSNFSVANGVLLNSTQTFSGSNTFTATTTFSAPVLGTLNQSTYVYLAGGTFTLATLTQCLSGSTVTLVTTGNIPVLVRFSGTINNNSTHESALSFMMDGQYVSPLTSAIAALVASPISNTCGDASFLFRIPAASMTAGSHSFCLTGASAGSGVNITVIGTTTKCPYENIWFGASQFGVEEVR